MRAHDSLVSTRVQRSGIRSKLRLDPLLVLALLPEVLVDVFPRVVDGARILNRRREGGWCVVLADGRVLHQVLDRAAEGFPENPNSQGFDEEVIQWWLSVP